jgi:hypothetical protein
MKLLQKTMCAVAVLVLAMSLAHAEEDQWKDCEAVIDRTMYYNEHINMKINAAEIHSRLANSPYEDIQCMARHGEIEAAFYKDNRIRLIKEMLKKDLKPDDYRVHKYLIQAFHGAHPEAAAMCDK